MKRSSNFVEANYGNPSSKRQKAHQRLSSMGRQFVELQRCTQNLVALKNELTFACVIHRLDGEVVDTNRSAREMLGFRPDVNWNIYECLGRNTAEDYCLNLGQPYDATTGCLMEFHINKDGATVSVAAHGSLLLSGLVQLVLIETKSEEELEALEEMIAVAIQNRDFSATSPSQEPTEATRDSVDAIAHELNNVFQILTLHSEFAESLCKTSDKSLRESVQQIVAATDNGTKLTSKLTGSNR